MIRIPTEIDGSWLSGRTVSEQEPTQELAENYADSPRDTIIAIEAYIANNEEVPEGQSNGVKAKIEGVNWMTDLSGGIQRVAILHGLAPDGNGKARGSRCRRMK